MRLLLLFLFTIFSIGFVEAKAPIKFGKISEELFSMTSYDKDTSATAVVLCDYGKFDPNQFQFTRIIRIKILKKDGLDWANWTFKTSEKATVRGKTYNMVNGEIEEIKLDHNKDVYREKITEDEYQLKVAMPGVQVGSVIDIKTTMVGLPTVWYFQYRIPVKHSELIIYNHEYVDFTKNFYGFEYLDINDPNRWVMNDVPAFKEEKYMNSYHNYLSKFEIEVSRIMFPQYYRTYATTWKSIQKRLYESDLFGKKLKGSRFLDKIAEEIKSLQLNKEDEISEAVKRIKQVKWNGKNQVFCSDNSLKSRYDNKLASSAELNIMLINLLKSLGYDSQPVVLSTRNNGILSMINPSMSRLNYVVAQVKTDKKEYLLDATDRYLSPLLIPSRCLNYNGRLIRENTNELVEITPQGKYAKRLMYNLEMDSTGQIEGSLAIQNIDYAARDKRGYYYSFSGEEDYIIDFEKRNPSFSVKDYSLSGLDENSEPVVENYNIKINTSGNAIGSKLLLNPMFEEQLTENPFKQEKRLFPIDFIYPTDKTLVLKLKLPNNAKVEELPESARIVIPDRSMSLIYNVEHKDGVIQLMYRLKIDNPIYTEDKYSVVKQLFAELVTKHSQNILISLIDSSGSPE